MASCASEYNGPDCERDKPGTVERLDRRRESGAGRRVDGDIEPGKRVCKCKERIVILSGLFGKTYCDYDRSSSSWRRESRIRLVLPAALMVTSKGRDDLMNSHVPLVASMRLRNATSPEAPPASAPTILPSLNKTDPSIKSESIFRVPVRRAFSSTCIASKILMAE